MMPAADMAFRGVRHFALVLPVALICQACGKPAHVVLYEQRQQMTQRGVRDVEAPVPRAKPGTARSMVEREVISGGGVQRGSRSDAIEVRELAPPPPRRPDRSVSAEVEKRAVTGNMQVAANTGPGVTTARAFERTAEAGSSYRTPPAGRIHVVTAKQTVYALSRLYGVPVRSLLVLNKLEPPYLLQTGQKIQIPVQRTHVVVAGETVYAISRRYDVSVAELVRINDIKKPFTIVTGQTVLLPDAQRTAVATAAPETEAIGDADEPGREERVASIAPPSAQRVVLPPSTNIPQPKELSGSGFLWPVDGKVISRFGGKGKGLRNDGINIAAPAGAPIRAAQNGVVAYRGNELRGFGNLILIKHDKGYMTAYAHASQILVERGARVKRGEVIARVGNTGSVGQHQLHFEIRRGRQPIDPLSQLRRARAELGDGAASPNG